MESCCLVSDYFRFSPAQTPSGNINTQVAQYKSKPFGDSIILEQNEIRTVFLLEHEVAKEGVLGEILENVIVPTLSLSDTDTSNTA